MATNGGPNIIQNGLAINLDGGNPKSYPGSGTTWTDPVAGNNFSLINGPVFDSGNRGTLNFDGSNDYAEISYTGDFTTNSYTYMFFSKSDIVGSRTTLVGFSDSSAPSGTHAYYCHNLQHWNGVNDRMVSFSSTGTSYQSFSSDTGLTITDWNFYCIAITPTNIKFVTNSTVQHDSSSPTARNNFDKIWLGTRRSGYDQQFNGKIANFMLYERELSTAEILQNYNALKSRFGL